MKNLLSKIILTTSVLIFLDQFSKYIIRKSGGFYICNANLAFGLSPFKIFFLLLGIFTIIILFNFKFEILNLKSIFNFKIKEFIGNWKLEIGNFSTIHSIAILSIISGGTSNIIDRFSFGCVIDFIDLKFWPVFNLADIFITAGVVFLIFYNFNHKAHNKK